MNAQELSRYIQRVDVVKRQYPEWRVGQTYFNVLLEFDPELAERIRGTDDDPFYDNTKIGRFLKRVVDNTY